MKRADKRFSFCNGRCVGLISARSSFKPCFSIGNYFLAGAQLFFRSLPSAIFLFSSITTSQVCILPCCETCNSYY